MGSRSIRSSFRVLGSLPLSQGGALLVALLGTLCVACSPLPERGGHDTATEPSRGVATSASASAPGSSAAGDSNALPTAPSAHPDGAAAPASPSASTSPSPATASGSAAQPEPPPPVRMTPCPLDMRLAGRACIDRYEAPNQEGAKPLRMQSALDAETWCKDHGKRLCSEDEWVRACEGPDRLAFPYGPKWQRGVCNDDGSFRNPSWKTLARWPAPEAVAEADKLDQSDPSGKREGCVSVEGVHDLSGNVAEWVRRTRDNPTNYEHVVKGCFWGRCFRPPHLPSCDYVNYAHPSGYRSYEMGFRCCSDPLL